MGKKYSYSLVGPAEAEEATNVAPKLRRKCVFAQANPVKIPKQISQALKVVIMPP